MTTTVQEASLVDATSVSILVARTRADPTPNARFPITEQPVRVVLVSYQTPHPKSDVSGHRHSLAAKTETAIKATSASRELAVLCVPRIPVVSTTNDAMSVAVFVNLSAGETMTVEVEKYAKVWVALSGAEATLDAHLTRNALPTSVSIFAHHQQLVVPTPSVQSSITINYVLVRYRWRAIH
jgi:hypothetical protein